MGIFDNIFGASKVESSSRPQPMEGLEKLTPTLYNLTNTAATRPYAKNPNARIAPFSQSQLAGMAGIRGVATDPRYGRQLGNAESLIGSSADDDRLSGMIGSLGRTITPERSSAMRWNDPGVSKAYMNPHTDAVLDRLLRREDQRTGERRAGLDAKLAGKGAFGDRGDLARAQFERDEEDRKADMIADQYAKAYESGANIFRSDEDRSSALGRANADRALQAEDLMTRGIGQGTTAENSRLAGRRAAGNDMSQLADRWRTGMTENARNLMGIGDREQQQAQKNLDLQTKDFEEQRDFPEDRANFTARILYGSPTGQKTTAPGPSLGSQILGAGIGGYGLGRSFGWWKKGGAVRLASGGMDDGISDDDLLSMLNDPETDDLTKESIRERLRTAEFGGIGMPSVPPPKPPVPMMKPPMAVSPGDADMPLPPPGPAATGGMRPPMMPEPASPSPEPDRYSSILEQLLEAQKPNKGMILARIGAAMMSGQKPGFLANVGEGIGAGVRGMEDEQQRRLRALGTMAAIEGRRQDSKERSEDRKLTQERLRKADEQRAEDRKDQLELRKQQAQDMKDYRDAMANRGKWTVGGMTPEGNVVLIDTNTGDSKTVEGVRPKQSGSGKPSVYELKKKDWLAIHPDDEEGAAKFASGQKQFSRADAERLANQLAKAQSAQEINPTKQGETYNRVFAETMERHGYSGASSAPAAPVGAPAPAAPKSPPAAGVAPSRPATVPAGSQYSPSRKQWRDPKGKLYDEAGNAI